jgi:hypothetical protein
MRFYQIFFASVELKRSPVLEAKTISIFSNTLVDTGLFGFTRITGNPAQSENNFFIYVHFVLGLCDRLRVTSTVYKCLCQNS